VHEQARPRSARLRARTTAERRHERHRPHVINSGTRRSFTDRPPSAPVGARRSACRGGPAARRRLRLRPRVGHRAAARRVDVGVELALRRVTLGVEQHLLRVDEALARLVGELVLGTEPDRLDRARLFAEAAEDAADHVDLELLRVALAERHGLAGSFSSARRRGSPATDTRRRTGGSRCSARDRCRSDTGGAGRGSVR
jgi:hypothetical protein